MKDTAVLYRPGTRHQHNAPLLSAIRAHALSGDGIREGYHPRVLDLVLREVEMLTFRQRASGDCGRKRHEPVISNAIVVEE